MSVRQRERTACADCGTRARVSSTEVMVHGGQGQRAYWTWMGLMLCPLCRSARTDWLTLNAYKRQLVHQPR